MVDIAKKYSTYQRFEIENRSCQRVNSFLFPHSKDIRLNSFPACFIFTFKIKVSFKTNMTGRLIWPNLWFTMVSNFGTNKKKKTLKCIGELAVDRECAIREHRKLWKRTQRIGQYMFYFAQRANAKKKQLWSHFGTEFFHTVFTCTHDQFRLRWTLTKKDRTGIFVKIQDFNICPTVMLKTKCKCALDFCILLKLREWVRATVKIRWQVARTVYLSLSLSLSLSLFLSLQLKAALCSI